jgi:hypothetical protein
MKVLKIRVNNIFEKNEPPIILFLLLLFLYSKLEEAAVVELVPKIAKSTAVLEAAAAALSQES